MTSTTEHSHPSLEILAWAINTKTNTLTTMSSESRARCQKLLWRICISFSKTLWVTPDQSLDFWFVPPETTEGDDVPLKAFATYLVIWVQVLSIPPNTVEHIPSIPVWAAMGLGYLIIPIVTKHLLCWWLFPRKNVKAIARLLTQLEGPAPMHHNIFNPWNSRRRVTSC